MSKNLNDYPNTKRRSERTKTLLKIEGVNLNKEDMTFYLEDLENKDYSNLIDAVNILDCNDALFDNYLLEFEAISYSNAKFKQSVVTQNHRSFLLINLKINSISKDANKLQNKDGNLTFGELNDISLRIKKNSEELKKLFNKIKSNENARQDI